MKDKIKIALFVAVLTVPTIIYSVISLFAPGLRTKIDFDLGEKREKATIEEGLSNYYSDRVPFRSMVISYYQSVNEAMEKPYNEVLMPAAMKLLYGGKKAVPMLRFQTRPSVICLEEQTILTLL